MAWQPRISARRRPDNYKPKVHDRLPKRKPETSVDAKNFAGSIRERAVAQRQENTDAESAATKAKAQAVADAAEQAERDRVKCAKERYLLLVELAAHEDPRVGRLRCGPAGGVGLLRTGSVLDDALAVLECVGDVELTIEDLHDDIESQVAGYEQIHAVRVANLERSYEKAKADLERAGNHLCYQYRTGPATEASLHHIEREMKSLAGHLVRYRVIDDPNSRAYHEKMPTRIVSLVNFEAAKKEAIAVLEAEVRKWAERARVVCADPGDKRDLERAVSDRNRFIAKYGNAEAANGPSVVNQEQELPRELVVVESL